MPNGQIWVGVFFNFLKNLLSKNPTQIPRAGEDWRTRANRLGRGFGGVRRSSEKFGEVRRSSERFGEVRGSSAIYIPGYPQATVGPKMHSREKFIVAPDMPIGFIWTHPTAELSQKTFFEAASGNPTEILLGFYWDSTAILLGLSWILLILLDSTGFY